MALELVSYRTDSGLRYSGMAGDRTLWLRAGSGRRNTSARSSRFREVSMAFVAGKTVNAFRCRYVNFRVINPPYPDLLPGRYHRIIIWRPVVFEEFAARVGGWTWNGVPVQALSVREEWRRGV